MPNFPSNSRIEAADRVLENADCAHSSVHWDLAAADGMGEQPVKCGQEQGMHRRTLQPVIAVQGAPHAALTMHTP